MYDDDVTKWWHFDARDAHKLINFFKNFISFFLLVVVVAVSHSIDSSLSICCEMYTVNEMRRNRKKN